MVGASHSLMSSDRLELRGSCEPEAHFPQLGPRFIPKNIGYALVTSGLADVFVSTLKRSGRMIGYQVLPVADVPIDVNTITFLINPAYTMSGSLDGLTGSRATSDRFFRHVPEMRSQYGSLYPASYFRLKEAYALKQKIEQQDKDHQAYFNQYNAGLLTEGDIDDSTSDSSSVGAISVSGDSDPAVKSLDDQIAAAQAELDTANNASSKDQAKVDELKKKLDDLKQAKSKREQSNRSTQGQQRQDEINNHYTDLSTRANAAASFASWQRKMENLQIRAGKRNIVNTYVWDSDGGFHAEEQQFASTVEHSIGGSFDLGFAIGGEGEFNAASLSATLSAQATVNLTQTMSKTERGSKGLELHVDLSGVESRGITDYRDLPPARRTRARRAHAPPLRRGGAWGGFASPQTPFCGGLWPPRPHRWWFATGVFPSCQREGQSLPLHELLPGGQHRPLARLLQLRRRSRVAKQQQRRGTRPAPGAERPAQQALARAPPRYLRRAPGADGLWAPSCRQRRGA